MRKKIALWIVFMLMIAAFTGCTAVKTTKNSETDSTEIKETDETTKAPAADDSKIGDGIYYEKMEKSIVEGTYDYNSLYAGKFLSYGDKVYLCASVSMIDKKDYKDYWTGMMTDENRLGTVYSNYDLYFSDDKDLLSEVGYEYDLYQVDYVADERMVFLDSGKMFYVFLSLNDVTFWTGRDVFSEIYNLGGNDTVKYSVSDLVDPDEVDCFTELEDPQSFFDKIFAATLEKNEYDTYSTDRCIQIRIQKENGIAIDGEYHKDGTLILYNAGGLDAQFYMNIPDLFDESIWEG